MKYLKSLILASTFLASSAYAIGFGFDLGPFDMQLNAPPEVYVERGPAFVNSPICAAIENQQRLVITVEGAENVSTKEKKIVTKKLIIEPYAFGMTNTGAPVLKGNVVEEKLIKEVTVKNEDDVYDKSSVSTEKKEGFFSGLFSSEKKVTIDIRRVSEIQIVDGSHFDVPASFKGITDPNVKVICQLPVAE